MFRRLYRYVQSVCVTLDIKFNQPDLYRDLTRPYEAQDMRNFTEVERPGE